MVVGNTSTGIYKETKPLVIDMQHIPELQAVEKTPMGVTIGAGASISRFTQVLQQVCMRSVLLPFRRRRRGRTTACASLVLVFPVFFCITRRRPKILSTFAPPHLRLSFLIRNESPAGDCSVRFSWACVREVCI